MIFDLKAYQREYQRAWKAARREQVNARRRELHAAHPEAARRSQRKWRESNPEASRAAGAKWKYDNHEQVKEYSRRWYSENREAAAERNARWKRENPARNAANAAAYANAKSKRMPPWVDRGALEAIYRGCPPGHHVDHVVPLRGRRVSGLHVPWNLQYLPAAENLSKGNRHG